MLSIAGLCLGFAAMPATAADIPVAPGNVISTVDTFTWTGAYIGIHAGSAWGSSTWSDPVTGFSSALPSSSGYAIGGGVGYNFQRGYGVLGCETDFTWLSVNSSTADGSGDNLNMRVNFSATFTGRAGLAFERLLVYGKAGVALAHNSSTVTDAFANVATSDALRVGWTAGAGVEYAISRNWSAKIEYDYLGFGTVSQTPTGPVLVTDALDIDLKLQELKAGFNLRF